MLMRSSALLCSLSADAFCPPRMPGNGDAFCVHVSPRSAENCTDIGSGSRRKLITRPSSSWATAGWMAYRPAVARMSPAATRQVWPPSALVTSRSSRCKSPSQATTIFPSRATNAEHGWLRAFGSSRLTMTVGFDQVIPLSSEYRTTFVALSQPRSDWVEKWKIRLPAVSRTGAWSFTSGTSKKSDAGSHRAAPTRSRLHAWASSRPGSLTHVYQAMSTSPFGQTHTAAKWLWVLNTGPNVSVGIVGFFPSAVQFRKYGLAGSGPSLGGGPCFTSFW